MGTSRTSMLSRRRIWMKDKRRGCSPTMTTPPSREAMAQLHRRRRQRRQVQQSPKGGKTRGKTRRVSEKMPNALRTQAGTVWHKMETGEAASTRQDEDTVAAGHEDPSSPAHR